MEPQNNKSLLRILSALSGENLSSTLLTTFISSFHGLHLSLCVEKPQNCICELITSFHVVKQQFPTCGSGPPVGCQIMLRSI